MYSLNSGFYPIVSVFYSIILVCGFQKIGIFIINFFDKEKIIKNISDENIQAILIGSVVVSSILYPFIIFNYLKLIYIKYFVNLLFLIGLYQIIIFLKKIKFYLKYKFLFKKNNLIEKIIFSFLILYFFLSLAPITSSDSLDYHIGLPLHFLNFNEYPTEKFLIHYQIAGPGEILNIIGLIIGADQTLSLIQFFGLASIVSIIKKLSLYKKNSKLILFILACPVLLFLISSSKPQLMYIGIYALLFTILLKTYLYNKVINDLFFFLIIFLIISAISAKFSFIASAAVIYFFVFLILYKKKFLKLISYSVIAFIILLLPKILWKNYYFNLSFFDSFFNIYSDNLYGYKQLLSSILECGYYGCYPYWLVFPKNLYSLTDSLGLVGIIFFTISLRKIKKKLLYVFIILVLQAVLTFKFGPNSARFFMENIIFFIVLLFFTNQNNNFITKTINKIIMLQSYLILVILFYAVFFISSGSLTSSLQKKVLRNNANGFSLFEWSNSVLPVNSTLWSMHRSHALSKIKTIPGNIFLYANIKDHKFRVYDNEIKKYKPNYILFYDDQKFFDSFGSCIGQLKFYKKNVGYFATRNPFGKEYRYYNGYIYEFKSKNYPECLFIKRY